MTTRLDMLLPGARRTLFLRACLLDREEAQSAWQDWLAGADDPVAAFADPRQADRRLGPLLAGLVTGAAGGRLGAGLAASVVREELRFGALAAAAAQTLELLEAGGVEAVVTGGVAASATVYEKPWLRHCHDVDLVAGSARARAGPILERAGLRRAPEGGGYVHPSGTLVALHAAPLRSPASALTFEDVRARAVSLPLAGSRAIGISREILLLRACEGAFVHGLPWSSLVWAADAASIARSLDPGGWSDVIACVERGRMATPAAACLGFLRDRVGVELPDTTLAELRERAAAEGPAGVRACLALVPRLSRTRTVLRRVRRGVARATGT